ncbi:double-stranded RNA-binding protein Staufen homolog 2 [Neocloeon triangulifer]|uniref:double-stranded RNA-binding protein Staufen homolog 2 n=1 Tax=Neocloeon triangulifer TaxID=2078957 RepID=UPI00286F66F2|nr:double-stranded RNA-binding protein Staufen homolog 2 [Neocloeon triangulifer]
MIHPAVSVHQLPRNQQPPNNTGNRMPHHQMPMRMPQPRLAVPQSHPHLVMGLQPSPAGVQMVPVAAPLVAAAVVSAPEEPPRAPAIVVAAPQQVTKAESVSDAAESEASDEAASASQLPNLANTKEKTPMCLINELARFNKITHQYRLTSETGPAHKKQFTVTLLLGSEEYTAEGASIKKAQHAAAANALVKTRFEHPPPKTQRVLKVHKANVTPTVELNALAMKRGEPTSYTMLEPLPSQFPPVYPRGLPYQRFHFNKQLVYPPAPPPVFYATLKVGEREFPGQGKTAQAAKHDAAAKALLELKALPLPENSGQENGQGKEDEDGCNLKSPISQVHEMALKRNMAVTFEVIKERGPPHMRTFLTSCKVGDIVTEGEGNSKKTSKKKAAENMLDELKKLPPMSPPELVIPVRAKKKQPVVKKKTRNLIKVAQEPKGKQEGLEEINPISRLIQIQQAKKEKEPEYTLVEDRNNSKRRQFAVMVSVGELCCTGYGPNKKMAKRSAAEAMLKTINCGGTETPADPKNKKDKTRKVKFQDEALVESKEPPSQPGGTSGRQLVPGLLLMTDGAAANGQAGGSAVKGAANPVCQTTALIAKELLNSGSSPTAEALVTAGKISGSAQSGQTSPPEAAPAPAAEISAEQDAAGQAAKPKELLSYLAKLLKFSVQYTDFPKVNQSEFLSLVSLTTNPPQTHHGAGPTIEAAQERAAHTALRALSEYGFNTANLNLKEQEKNEN